MGRRLQREADNAALLRAALAPFVTAYQRDREPIGDSDLDNAQPRSVSVTLGDCRKAARVLFIIDTYWRD